MKIPPAGYRQLPPRGGPLLVRRLGRRDYLSVFRAMQAFTDSRDPATWDELWRVEHPPVFTQGLNGRPEHLLAPGGIPVIAVDRGGQVTYHGPGQVVVYLLLDLRRAQLGVRRLVTLLEQAVVDLLAMHGIQGYARPEAPGVYVAGAKLASLGLRVRRGCSYHGLSLNVDMDLEPFSRIDPCGYPGLRMTQLRDLGLRLGPDEAGEQLLALLIESLGYTTMHAAQTLPPAQETGDVRIQSVFPAPA